MTRKWPVVGVLLALLWLFVRGVFLEPVNLVEEFIIGLAVGMPIAYAARRFFRPTLKLGESIASVPYAVVYVLLFVYELVTANLDVAYRVLAPSLPIRPDVVEIPLRVQSDLAITTIANSITLTPGTLTMDHDPERNSLFVHTISGQDRESVVAPIRRWEDYALIIFDEPLDPGDPVPDPERRAERKREMVDESTDGDRRTVEKGGDGDGD